MQAPCPSFCSSRPFPRLRIRPRLPSGRDRSSRKSSPSSPVRRLLRRSFLRSGSREAASFRLRFSRRRHRPGRGKPFATAILFGDQGYLTTAELRHDSAFGAVPGTFRSSLFFDASEVTYAGELLSFAGPGAGERWQGPGLVPGGEELLRGLGSGGILEKEGFSELRRLRNGLRQQGEKDGEAEGKRKDAPS